MATIALSGVRKTYGHGPEVIKGVDIEVGDGEFLVLLGPSGCGKSTLLRMVAGLETVTAGTVAIAGRVVNELEPADRNIAMVFQNYALYPHMSVFDNMAYGLRIRGLPKAAIRERVAKTAGILGLGAFLDRKPRQLSGGQRQRVAMGRAIVREPAAFLFDEPLSNLDAQLRTQMRVEIKQLQQRLGTTSLYVTHDQVEAMTLADRIMVMNEGRAEQIGTPMDIYCAPATRFVAGFIGSPAMNFLPAIVDGDGEGPAVRLADGRRIAVASPAAGPAGRPVTLGIRPEHLEPVAGSGDGAGGAAGDNRILVRVDLVEPLGAETVIHASLPAAGGSVLSRLPGIALLRQGEPLHLIIPPAATHLFDRESGRRLTPA